MTIKTLVSQSVSRAKRWHNGSLNEWSPLEWAGAMAGEAGEAANAAKKLKRVESNYQNLTTDLSRSLTEREVARKAIAREAADTILYAVLLIGVVGGDVEQVLADVFNQKSVEYGFPERLPYPEKAEKVDRVDLF